VYINGRKTKETKKIMDAHNDDDSINKGGDNTEGDVVCGVEDVSVGVEALKVS